MNYSGSDLAILLVMGLLFGLIGYLLSENFRKMKGRTPWGMPSALWGFIWFLSLLLGLVLYLIARVTTKVDGVARPGPSPYRAGWPPGPTQPSAPTPPPPAQPYSTGAPAAAPTLSPPMWHPDPSSRFDYRWWDGRAWTTRVARNGTQLDDGNPDQRLGPVGPPDQP
jgi:hypothetical protein